MRQTQEKLEIKKEEEELQAFKQADVKKVNIPALLSKHKKETDYLLEKVVTKYEPSESDPLGR